MVDDLIPIEKKKSDTLEQLYTLEKINKAICILILFKVLLQAGILKRLKNKTENNSFWLL